MTGWEKFIWGCVAVCMIVVLGGCETIKAVSDACREGLCR